MELWVDPTPLQAVDLMHDVELGVAKAIVLHIMRLLTAQGGEMLEQFDARLVLSKVENWLDI